MQLDGKIDEHSPNTLKYSESKVGWPGKSAEECIPTTIKTALNTETQNNAIQTGDIPWIL